MTGESCLTGLGFIENEIFYLNAQDLIDEYTLHPLEENDTEKYRLDVNTGIWYGED